MHMWPWERVNKELITLDTVVFFPKISIRYKYLCNNIERPQLSIHPPLLCLRINDVFDWMEEEAAVFVVAITTHSRNRKNNKKNTVHSIAMP